MRHIIKQLVLLGQPILMTQSGNRKKILVRSQQRQAVAQSHRGDESIDRFQLPSLTTQRNLEFGGQFGICLVRNMTRQQRFESFPFGAIVYGSR